MNNTLNSLPRKLFEVAGSLVPPKAEAASFSPIFVAGFARSGKTLITKNLKNEYGMSTFGLDLIRDPAYSDTAVRRRFFDLLLRLYPRGLIVEGDNLSGENISRSKIQDEDEFKTTIDFLRARGALIFFVGNADSSVDDKITAIHAYRQQNICWTSDANYGTKQLRDLATRSVKYSQSLRQFAERAGVTYLEIRPENYFEDTKRAIIEITSQAIIV